jgi:Holliday junction resolvasome RuvABC endonuclease subunit
LNKEKVLSLDISTKTGWAFLESSQEGMKLFDYGTLEQIHKPDGKYPDVYVDWSISCFYEIVSLITKFKPDVLVIEETSKGSKNALSQKILEYLHYNLACYIKITKIRSTYILTEQWRREIGCKMNDSEKARNKEVRDFKKAYKKKTGKSTSIAYDSNQKRIGLIGRKHINIRRVSEIFEGQLRSVLRRKDEDLADGLGLAACYHLRRMKNDGNVQEITFEDLIKD